MKGLFPLVLAGFATTGAAISAEHVWLAVTTVGLVVAVINFIDKRVESRLKPVFDEVKHVRALVERVLIGKG